MENWNDILNQFSGDLNIKSIFVVLAFSLICSIIICIVYKKTFMGVSYNKNYSFALILMALVCSIAIKTVNTNITLSLGMLGSLSIIRFRTAVKDIIDIVFMFWAILIGIMCGADLFIPCIIMTFMISIIYIVYFIISLQKNPKYMVVLKINNLIIDNIKNLDKKNGIYLKSENYNKEFIEFTFKVSNKKLLNNFNEFKDNNNVISMNILQLD